MDQNLDNVELKKDLKAAMEVLSEQRKTGDILSLF